MPTAPSLVGQRFGSRIILSLATTVGAKSKKWNFLCDCGRKGMVEASNLKKSASCSHSCPYFPLIVHGMKRHPAYRTWEAMRYRCSSPKYAEYHLYGARGITFCERWKSFESFWADMGPTWQKGLSLDRIDNSGNYHKDNCRWATMTEQANNTRRNKWLDTPAGRLTLSQAGRKFGLSKGCIEGRIARGCPPDKLFLKPFATNHQ